MNDSNIVGNWLKTNKGLSQQQSAIHGTENKSSKVTHGMECISVHSTSTSRHRKTMKIQQFV